MFSKAGVSSNICLMRARLPWPAITNSRTVSTGMEIVSSINSSKYLFYKSFFRYTHLNHTICHLHRVRRNIHHCWQLHSFSISHIKLATMPRADDVKAFEIAFPHWAIVMRTYIANRKKL